MSENNRSIAKVSHDECCGCQACIHVCPVSAITGIVDERGFLYPQVDHDICMNCGKCEKVCAVSENYAGVPAKPILFAAKHEKDEIVLQSSSGGSFSKLMEYVFSQNGIVYGAQFDDDFRVVHGRAENLKEAEKFRSSKYVQSDLSGIYKLVADDLGKGRMVLFSGTPCQVNAVRKYLMAAGTNMAQLYLCEVICHGVSSPGTWREYFNIVKSKYVKDPIDILNVNMRSKKHNWEKQRLEIEVSQGSISENIQKFSYNTFYHSSYGTRPSCFQCHYVSMKRTADLTLGDFWNKDQLKLKFDISNGVNEVLINTAKGKKLFDQAFAEAKKQKLPLKAGWQPHLEYASKMPKKYDAFWTEYLQNEDKESVFLHYMKGSLISRSIQILSPVLRKLGLYQMAGQLYKKVFIRK